MLSLFKSAAERELDSIIAELQANLENNYKDTARAALEKLGAKIKELSDGGILKPAQYRKYMGIYNEYSVKMTGYHH